MDLLERLRKARGIFDRQRDRELEGFRKNTQAGEVVQTNVWIVSVEVVGDVTVDLRDDRSATSGPRVQGDIVSQGDLRDVLNATGPPDDAAAPELARRLEDLQALVTQLLTRLPEEEAQAAARDLKALAAEVSSRKPRKPFYEISAHGLVSAAWAVAELAGPIRNAIEELLKPLS
jgi:hypothetical protein